MTLSLQFAYHNPMSATPNGSSQQVHLMLTVTLSSVSAKMVTHPGRKRSLHRLHFRKLKRSSIALFLLSLRFATIFSAYVRNISRSSAQLEASGYMHDSLSPSPCHLTCLP